MTDGIGCFSWLAVILALKTSLDISFAQILVRSKWLQEIVSAKWITPKMCKIWTAGSGSAKTELQCSMYLFYLSGCILQIAFIVYCQACISTHPNSNIHWCFAILYRVLPRTEPGDRWFESPDLYCVVLKPTDQIWIILVEICSNPKRSDDNGRYTSPVAPMLKILSDYGYLLPLDGLILQQVQNQKKIGRFL